MAEEADVLLDLELDLADTSRGVEQGSDADGTLAMDEGGGAPAGREGGDDAAEREGVLTAASADNATPEEVACAAARCLSASCTTVDGLLSIARPRRHTRSDLPRSVL